MLPAELQREWCSLSDEYFAKARLLVKRNEMGLNPTVGDSFSGRGVTNCVASDPTGYNGAYMDG